jgi:hypothetical protein
LLTVGTASGRATTSAEGGTIVAADIWAHIAKELMHINNTYKLMELFLFVDIFNPTLTTV